MASATLSKKAIEVLRNKRINEHLKEDYAFYVMLRDSDGKLVKSVGKNSFQEAEEFVRLYNRDNKKNTGLTASIDESLKESNFLYGKVIYTIQAYDKDNDIYDDLDKGEDLDALIEEAISLTEKMFAGQLKSKKGEPYDWIEVVDDRYKVYWASYDDYNKGGSDLKEGNANSGNRTTGAQRYNARMNKIFDHKKMLDRAQAKYLKRLGVSDEEIEDLKARDKLQVKLIDMGEKDNFFAKYDFSSGVLKESTNESKGDKVKLTLVGFDRYEGGDNAEYKVDDEDAIKSHILKLGYTTTFRFSDDVYKIKEEDIKKVRVVAITINDMYRDDFDVEVYIDIDDNMDLIYCGRFTNSNDVQDVEMVEKVVNDWMRTGKTIKAIKEDFMMEDTMKKDYNELFGEFLDLIEFSLIKNDNGTFSLEDRQGGNIGNIEEREYTTAYDMIEDLDIYIDDYIIRAIGDELRLKGKIEDDDFSYYPAEDLLKYRDLLPDSAWDFDVLDMLVNHSDEIDLDKVAINLDESLKESRLSAPYKYRGCKVQETMSSWVATAEDGLTIGSSRTRVGAEALIDDYLDGKYERIGSSMLSRKDESIEEDDTPWNKEQLESEIKSLTQNYTRKKDQFKCGFDEEKDMAIEILERNGYKVNVDKQGGWWYIDINKKAVEEKLHQRKNKIIKEALEQKKERKKLNEDKQSYLLSIIEQTKQSIERDKKMVEVARKEAELDTKHKAYFDKIIKDLESHIKYNEDKLVEWEKQVSPNDDGKDMDIATYFNSKTTDSSLTFRDEQNRKALEDADKIKPSIIKNGQPGYDNLVYASRVAEQKSPCGYRYKVEDTYLDFGANMQWTTLIAYKQDYRNDSYQALNPVEWDKIVNAKDNSEIDATIDEMFKDEYCPDRLGRRVQSAGDAFRRLDMLD